MESFLSGPSFSSRVAVRERGVRTWERSPRFAPTDTVTTRVERRRMTSSDPHRTP